jgi:hypothetical protein
MCTELDEEGTEEEMCEEDDGFGTLEGWYIFFKSVTALGWTKAAAILWWLRRQASRYDSHNSRTHSSNEESTISTGPRSIEERNIEIIEE